MTMLSIDLAFRRGVFQLATRAEFGAGVTGICGPSGSGKSTLLALIAGLLKPASGQIRFDDEVLADPARGQFVPPWQRHFGLVFQDGQLFPHLRVRDNLLYGYHRLAPQERHFELEQVTQLLEIGELQAETGQVELDVEGEAGMSTGQHEPVAADPARLRGIVAHGALEEGVGDRREAHRGAGVPVARLLHRVRGQDTGGVDGLGVEVRPVAGVVPLSEGANVVCD